MRRRDSSARRLPISGLRLGSHVKKDFYIAYYRHPCRLRHGDLLSQECRQGDSCLLATRAREPPPTLCFKSSRPPSSFGQIAVEHGSTPHTYTDNTYTEAPPIQRRYFLNREIMKLRGRASSIGNPLRLRAMTLRCLPVRTDSRQWVWIRSNGLVPSSS